MDLQKFKAIQTKYASRDRERMDMRIELHDTDMSFRERIAEEMLMDLLDRVEALEAVVRQVTETRYPKD